MPLATDRAGARRATALIATGALALGGALGGLASLRDDLGAAAEPVMPAAPVPGDALETTPLPATPPAPDAAPPTEPGVDRPATTREY